MPAWMFAVSAGAFQKNQRWQDRLRAPPELPGKEKGRPVVSFRRLDAAEKTKKTGLLDMEEQLLLREVFDSYDRDQSQELDKMQMRDLMAALNDGMYPTDMEVHEAMAECDTSKSGGIDFAEFVKAITWWYQNTHPDDYLFKGATVHERRMEAAKQAKTFYDKNLGDADVALHEAEEKLAEEVFKKYDKDGAQQINSGELKAMMTDLNSGIPPTEQELAFLMWSNDFGQTGTLSLNEFKQAVVYWYSQTHTGSADATAALAEAQAAGEEEDAKQKEDSTEPQGQQKSACCVVS